MEYEKITNPEKKKGERITTVFSKTARKAAKQHQSKRSKFSPITCVGKPCNEVGDRRVRIIR